mmetsp:Transcript_52752/g.157306  ORF Transcript_52752/g.157306 Transcript_52752/m.157306 type:complete len:295 (-) Transcript_52752:1432-2316(-)
MVLAPGNAVLDELKLMLLALEVAVQGFVLRSRGLELLELGPDLVKVLLLVVHLLLKLGKLLQFHEDVAALGSRAARDRAGRVVEVALLRDGANPNVGVEADLLGCLRRVAHKETTEDVPHGALDFPLEANDLQRAVQLSALRHDALGLLDRRGGDRGVHDLVQRDNRYPAPQLAALEQRLARLLVVRDDEEEAAAGADLQRPVVGLEVGADVEKLGHDALHGVAVEAPVGVLIVEVNAAEVSPQGVQTLVQRKHGGLALPRGMNELLVGLGVELQLLQLRALLGNDAVRECLLL